MYDLKQLRVLQAVGEAGSFSAAAERLDYTQPAVSKIVAALERDAGTTLVDRGIRPLRLTDAGDALVRRAAAAFEQLAAAEAEVEAIRQLDGGTLRIVSVPGVWFVVEALREFRAGHPDVTVTLAERPGPTAERDVRDGDADLAIVFDHEGTADGLEAVALLDDPLDAVVPAGHPLAAREAIALEDLRGEPWVLPNDCPELRLIRRGCGFEPRAAYRIDDCHMTQALVAAGEGIALLPRLMLHPPHPGVAIKPLGDVAPVRRVVALRLPARFLTPPTKHFLELLQAWSTKRSTWSSAPST
jgi:DNA-binding transcriptional LysR family regulator